MTERKIEIGKRYILIHGDCEGPDYGLPPAAISLDIMVPVTVIKKHRTDKNSTRWKIKYTTKNGIKATGYASDRSFGDEVK